jgi:hypothetical protein
VDRPTISTAAIGGVVLAASGIWALAAPHSFYDVIATFPPYNRHLIHDAGAFLAGLGAAFLVGLKARRAITVALVGNAVAAVLHEVSHIVDRDLGGKASDPWVLGAVAVLFVVVAARAVKEELA